MTPCLYDTVCFRNSGAHLPATRRRLPAHHNLACCFLANVRKCVSGSHASLCDSDVGTRGLGGGGVELVGLGDGGDETSCQRSAENCVMINGVIDRAHRVW